MAAAESICSCMVETPTPLPPVLYGARPMLLAIPFSPDAAFLRRRPVHKKKMRAAPKRAPAMRHPMATPAAPPPVRTLFGDDVCVFVGDGVEPELVGLVGPFKFVLVPVVDMALASVAV